MVGKNETKKKKRKRGQGPPSRKEAGRPSATGSSGIPIVGIGASAGGLAALQQVFTAMPPESGMAFVVVVHLDPGRKSAMAELLGKVTRMPVVEAAEDTRVRRDHVYVIPPNRELEIRDGALHLALRERSRAPYAPIDVLLRTLAEDQEERAIGVLLSGTGTDGTLGLKAVKAHGGMTVAQAPDTAEHDGMVRSAIGSGAVDHVLPPERIPEVLVRYARHPYVMSEGPSLVETPEGLQTILALLRARTGRDFSGYRKTTLARRVQRRMGLRYLERLEDYVELLRADSEELTTLAHDFLIQVSDFFRDPPAWDVIRRHAVVPLVAAKGHMTPIRVWVPGCATGEEAYSLAMVLLEEVQDARKSCPLQIFASDVDAASLDLARAGVYPTTIAARVSLERLQRFFFAVDDGNRLQVGRQLRDAVIFAQQDLMRDAPFSRLDMVSCRNVLIYLERDVQERVLSLFHFALREEGYLWLGNSESIGDGGDLFEPVSRKWRLYRRVGATRRDRVTFPVIPAPDGSERAPGLRRSAGERRLEDPVQQLILERFTAAAVLINRRYEVLHFYGPTEQYLAQPGGPPVRDLFALAREGLRTKLRALVVEAARGGVETTGSGLRVKRRGSVYRTKVTVTPIRGVSRAETPLLVVFEDEPHPALVGPQQQGPEGDLSGVVGELEQELKITREDLQTNIEELESSNEELTAANEEITSINEELQSTNEELESSKEELQSLNEELSTVNQQLQHKVEELEQTNNDLTNLLTSTDLATIFLDTRLRIRRFTPATTALLNLLQSDVGRPLSDLASPFVDQTLVPDAHEVLQTLVTREAEVRSDTGRWYVRRLLPYRTEDDRIDGLVVTFIDVTSLKAARDDLEALNRTLETRVEQRTGLLELLTDTAVGANEAGSIDEAVRMVLARVCEYSSWRVGHAFRLATDGTGDLVSTGAWYADPPDADEPLRAVTAPLRVRSGEGLLGRVYATGQPVVVRDLRHEPDGERTIPRDSTVVSAAMFPVPADGRTVGVLEFFSDRPIELEEPFLDAMASVAIQLGHVVNRHELEHLLVNAAREEQWRIGEHLHDTLAQQVTGAAMLARTLATKLERAGAGDTAGEAATLAEQVEAIKDHARALTRGLAPVEVDPGGLTAALESLTQEIGHLYGVRAQFTCPLPVSVPDTLTATKLFFIAREAVHNAVQHGRPSEVVVSLEQDAEHVRLRVRDDGAGLPPDWQHGGGVGLRLIKHRTQLIGARLSVNSTRGEGVEVVCVLPRG